MPESTMPSVLCVDDHRDLAELVQAVLVDEGYAVSCLYEQAGDALLRMVGRLEPDCVLLDSSGSQGYGDSWELASVLHRRRRPIPVIMFSGHPLAIREAREGVTERAKDAAFAAILSKPFDLDELLAAVAIATGQSVRFDRSSQGENRRTRELARALEAFGASDVRPSKLREWALFRDRSGDLCQVYWWQLRGVYQVGRYDDEGQLVMLGQFISRDAAIEIALPG